MLGQKKKLDSVKDRSQLLSFADHISELRRRLASVGLVCIAGSVLAYEFREPIMQAVTAPLHGEGLVYLTPGGGFSFVLHIMMYAGLAIAAPAFFYQLYAFLRPVFPKSAHLSAVKVVAAALLLMVLGVGYGYLVAVPAALTFLNTFAGDMVTPNLTADSYLSFFIAYTGGLALLFQLPLFLLFWHWVKPLGPGGLLKSERWVILFSFVAAALITPTPDVVNQIMIALPVILIYQAGVVVVALSIRKSRRKSAKIASQAAMPVPQAAGLPSPKPVVARVPLASDGVPAAITRRPVATVREKSMPALGPANTRPMSRRSIDGFVIRQRAPLASERAKAY